MRVPLALVALSGLIAVGAAAPAALGGGPAPSAVAAAACSGHVTEEVDGTTVRAGRIRTRGMGCKSGKRLIGRFLRKADRNRRCCRASERPPPTRGCAVGRCHCWRGVATYCHRPAATSAGARSAAETPAAQRARRIRPAGPMRWCVSASRR